MVHTTDYTNTFIEVAEDCRAAAGIEPPSVEKKTLARMQYEFLADKPYAYTSDELLFEIYAIRNEVEASQWEAARAMFFSKGQACMRSSDLPKKYGWGIHYDEDARMALYAMDSPEYARLKDDSGLVHKRAMRSTKKP